VTDDLLLGDLSDDEIEALASTLTPNLGLPYPSSNDPVAAGATNIRDLALAIDSNAKLWNLPILAPSNAAGSLRAGAYVGEEILIHFWHGYWTYSQNGALARARWFDDGASGTGPAWCILGSPVELTIMAAPGFGLGATTTNDQNCMLDMPKWVYGNLSGGCQMDSGITDVILTDSAGHNTYWSAGGRNLAWVNVVGAFSVLQGRCYLQYFSQGGAVSNRWLRVSINKLIPG
jgi:hypothetical protein